MILFSYQLFRDIFFCNNLSRFCHALGNRVLRAGDINIENYPELCVVINMMLTLTV